VAEGKKKKSTLFFVEKRKKTWAGKVRDRGGKGKGLQYGQGGVREEKGGGSTTMKREIPHGKRETLVGSVRRGKEFTLFLWGGKKT